MKGLLHGNSSRVSSPPAGHPATYGRFVMDKYIKAKRYLSTNFPIFIPYFPKRLILDKEELILDKKEEILSLR